MRCITVGPSFSTSMNKQVSNIWDALFDYPGEKAVLAIKSRLMDEIRQHLKKENLTQEKAERLLKF